MEEKSIYEEEIRIKVPLNFIDYPLGFVIDAGGSVMKLLYRSKEDYEDCKSKHGDQSEGELRVRYFPIGCHERLFNFVKSHVDMSREVGVDREKVWFHTGVSSTYFKKFLQDSFNIKMSMRSEMIALSKLRQLHDHAECLKPLPVSLQATRYCIKFSQQLIALARGLQDRGDNTLDMFSADADRVQKEDETVVGRLFGLLLNSDEEGMLKEFNKMKISFPCVVVLCGSAFAIIVLNEDGTFKPCDYQASGGKTFFALGEELTGAKDFDDLMRKAKAGDSDQVDLSCKDVRGGGGSNSNDNCYSSLPEDFVVFNMGKLSSHNIESKKAYKKEDMASGFLNLWCQNLAQWTLLNARLKNVKDIVFCGSFVKNQLVKERLERYCLSLALMNAMEEKRYIHSHFLSNPGFVCALGVWCQNVEDMKKDS